MRTDTSPVDLRIAGSAPKQRILVGAHSLDFLMGMAGLGIVPSYILKCLKNILHL